MTQAALLAALALGSVPKAIRIGSGGTGRAFTGTKRGGAAAKARRSARRRTAAARRASRA